GVLNVQGGSSNGINAKTGNGGDSTIGIGGNSGSVAAFGGGGDAGTVKIACGGDFLGSEATVAIGGAAAKLSDNITTGNGGKGSLLGGKSGDIGSVGNAGKGGT